MDTFKDTLTGVAADLRGQQGNECPFHPGGPRYGCDDCQIEAAIERNANEEKAHKAGIAAACDNDFPRRYRCAKADHPDVLAWVERYLANPGNAQGLLLMGATGTGKTHQAYGALRTIATHTEPYKTEPNSRDTHWTRIAWRATTMADLNASMRPGGDRDPENTLARNRNVDMLLIDDLAAARSSEWVEEHIYRLINGRYEDMRTTIFTTNLEPTALREAVGDRIASRLVESCQRIVLDGPDLRRNGIARPERCPVHTDTSACVQPANEVDDGSKPYHRQWPWER